MNGCEVEHCGRIANLGGLCLLHRRKDIAGQLEYDDDNRIWDTCAQGHRWTLENTHIESDSKGGKRRRCKQCLRDKAQRKREEEPVILPPQPVRLADPVFAGAFGLFDKVQNHVDGLCRDKSEQWMDYDAAHIPTSTEATLMCNDCPLLAACANSALAQNKDDEMSPGWGVWGGEVWVYGKKYDEGGKELIHEDD